MNFKAEDIIDRMAEISNMKYLGVPDFSDKRKNWCFFVSNPILIILKRESIKYLGICNLNTIRNIRILDYEIFGLADLDDSTIYFAKKYKIKED